MPVQRALIAEPGSQRRLGDGRARPEFGQCRLQPDLRQIGMRRQARRPLEQSNELEGRQAHARAHVVERQLVLMPVDHQRLHPACKVAVAGSSRDALAAAAVPAKQYAEAVHQQLALLERVAPLVEGPVERQEGGDQGIVPEGVGGEVRRGLDTQKTAHRIDGRLAQIKAAIAPAPAPAHASRMRLGGVEHQERRGARFVRGPPALELCAAVFRDRDDEGIVTVGRIVMAGEISGETAQPGDMGVLPVA